MAAVVDLFSGAGGATIGAVLECEALGRDTVRFIAVNHWTRAIETHQENHPETEHYNAKVEELNPRDVVGGDDVILLLAGPECTHFSTARGGRPVSEQKRASPWHVLDWVEKLQPENLLLENVPEFESWGPVIDGQPTRNGEIFEQYVNTLGSYGYAVEWRVLNAADYGDATTRRRFFLIARRAHRVEWPDPTHSEGGEEPGTESWCPAAEIIDWSDPGESIWGRSRPLVNNTMQRIAEGLRRYGSDVLEPYADAVAGLTKSDVKAMQADAVDLGQLDELTEIPCELFLVRFSHGGATPDANDPVPTITTARCGDFALCVPYLLGQQSGSRPRNVCEKPCMTIASGGAISKIEPRPFVLPRNGAQRGLFSNPAYDPEERPLHTVTAQNHDGWLIRPVPSYLVPSYGERDGQDPRTHDLEEPLPTVPGTVQHSLVSPYLVQYNGESDCAGVEKPVPTIPTKDRFALVHPDLYPWGLDIRFRMLQPRELAAAMGFPEDYVFVGNKTDTVKQIGNAVPVNLARALCRTLLTTSTPTVDGYGEPVTGGEPADD